MDLNESTETDLRAMVEGLSARKLKNMRKPDLVALVLRFMESPSLTDRVRVACASLGPSLDPMTKVRASLAMHLAEELEQSDRESRRATAQIAAELGNTLDRLQRGRPDEISQELAELEAALSSPFGHPTDGS